MQVIDYKDLTLKWLFSFKQYYYAMTLSDDVV